MERLLVLNPGGGSTRVAGFEGPVEAWRVEVRHPAPELGGSLEDQAAARLRHVRAALAERGVVLGELAAVVGRGGPYAPLHGGTYRVDAALVDFVLAGRSMVDHPSNLGAVLAFRLAEEAGGIPAFVVDPVSVDELDPVARLTGLPEFPRQSLFHALNIRAVARRHAARLGRPLADLTLVVAHLGSGTSVALIRDGRVVDVNNSADEGPFSARRAGGLPARQLLRATTSPGFDPDALERRMMAEGGLFAHLGTPDLEEAEARADAGDAHAALVLEALAYTVAKAVGAMAAAAGGGVDAVLLTGGMVRSVRLAEDIARRVRWIAPVVPWPGEEELPALAEGALRVLRGAEAPRRFVPEPGV